MADHQAAAKAALRRKKMFEHTLEQTQSQIMTLEQEVYSIESANINKETLDAMKSAGAAMKHIHAGLTIDTVDETMYDLLCPINHSPANELLGNNSAISTQSATRSPRRFALALTIPSSTKMISTRSSQNSSKSNSTSRCSTQEPSLWATKSVASPWRRRPRSEARHLPESKKTTRRKSSESCRQRWPRKARLWQEGVVWHGMGWSKAFGEHSVLA